jgi:hypothetical protein
MIQQLVLKFVLKKLLIISLIIIFVTLFFKSSFSQQQGDFRTIASGNWSDNTIWQKYDTSSSTWNSTISSPTASDNAIGITFGNVVSFNSGITLDQLTINGTLALNAGHSLNISNGAGHDLTLVGNINGAGNINILSGASMDLQNGSVSGTGALNNNLGGVVTPTSGTVAIDRTFNNNGTFNWASGTVNGSGIFNNNNIFNIHTLFGGSLNLPLINNGTINKTSSPQNLFLNSFQNPGTVNVTSGNITLAINSGSITLGGIINVSSGGTFQLGNNSSANFTVNASISGAGNFTGYSSSVNFSTSCIYNISGNTIATGGTMNFNPGMTLTNIGNLTPSGGAIVLPVGLTVGGYGPVVRFSGGGSLSLNTGTTFNFQKVAMFGGNLLGSDSLHISDSLTLSTGFISGGGAIKLNPGCYMTVNNNTPTFDKTLINNGTINWTLASVFGTGTLYNNSVMNMTASAFSWFMPMVNAGTINKSSNTVAQFSANFTNLSSGVLNITAGTYMTAAGSGTWSIAGNINVSSGALFQLGNSATATYNVTGSITGAGSFAGHTTNINFLPGCTYNIAGNTTIFSGTTTFNSGINLTNIGTIGTTGGTLNLQPGLVIPSIGPALTISGGGTINFNTGGSKFQFTSITMAGTMGGSDTVNLAGNMTITSGVFSGAGLFNILLGSVMDINFSGITVHKIINNAGTINWFVGTISGNGVINNNNNFNIATTAGFSINPLVNNNGTLNKTTNSPTQMIGCNNSGTFNVNSGTLQIVPTSGTFTHSGIFNVASGTTLTLGQVSGSITQTVNGSITGTGNVTFGAANNNFGPSSVYNISGNTSVTSGTTNFNAGMTITSLGNLSVANGTLNLPSGLILGGIGSNLVCSSAGLINFNTGNSHTFNQIDLSGTIGGSDSVFINTTLNWTAGGNASPSKMILETGASTTINSSAVTVGGTFINNGTCTWVQQGINGNGTFINNNILNFSTNNTFSFVPALINNATVNKTTANISPLVGNLTNNSNININIGGISVINGNNSGTITLTNNTTFSENNGTFTSTGSMVIPSNSFITGNGILVLNQSSVVNDGTISLNTVQFGATTNLSGSGVINTQSATFLNGCNVTLLSNQQFKYANILSGGTFNLNGYKASFNGSGTPFSNSGTLNLINSTIELNGTSSQTVPHGITFKNLYLNNTAGTNSAGTLNVNDTVKVLAGFLNIVSHTLALGTTGYLSEINGAVRGTTGSITATRTLTNPFNVNVAGLGATITSEADLGLTTISRGFTNYTINGSGSILRYYNISPANNTNLNASLTYHYDNTELNGLNENLLSLFRSTNSGTNWSTIGGAKDTANNNITCNGINAFSYWTAAVNPLAASITITAIVDALYNTSNNTLNKKDSITVYLRNSFEPYSILDSAKILLDTLTFSGTAFFNTTPSGTYYISLKYRNALETWTKSGGETYTTGTSMAYDFTTAQSQAYGNSTVLKNGKYCIVSGDLNQDGFVNGNDFTLFSQQFGLTGYLSADLNGDNNVNGNDFTAFSASFGKQNSHP